MERGGQQQHQRFVAHGVSLEIWPDRLEIRRRRWTRWPPGRVSTVVISWQHLAEARVLEWGPTLLLADDGGHSFTLELGSDSQRAFEAIANAAR